MPERTLITLDMLIASYPMAVRLEYAIAQVLMVKEILNYMVNRSSDISQTIRQARGSKKHLFAMLRSHSAEVETQGLANSMVFFCLSYPPKTLTAPGSSWLSLILRDFGPANSVEAYNDQEEHMLYFLDPAPP